MCPSFGGSTGQCLLASIAYSSPNFISDSTWSLSGTLLTENPAYDHTHQALVASLNWQPKRSGRGKFQLWKPQYYETPIVTHSKADMVGVAREQWAEQSYHIYERPMAFAHISSSISCSNHYEQI